MTGTKFAMINGMQIFTNMNMTEDGPLVDKKIKRTWKERFWSYEWRPTHRTIKVGSRVPSRNVIMAGGRMFCHPAMLDEIKRAI